MTLLANDLCVVYFFLKSVPLFLKYDLKDSKFAIPRLLTLTETQKMSFPCKFETSSKGQISQYHHPVLYFADEKEKRYHDDSQILTTFFLFFFSFRYHPDLTKMENKTESPHVEGNFIYQKNAF